MSSSCQLGRLVVHPGPSKPCAVREPVAAAGFPMS